MHFQFTEVSDLLHPDVPAANRSGFFTLGVVGQRGENNTKEIDRVSV
jgi:hypothetical protein